MGAVMNMLDRINESFILTVGVPLESVLPLAVIVCLWAAIETVLRLEPIQNSSYK